MGRWLVHQKDSTEKPLVKWLEARGCRYQHLGQPVDGLLAIHTRTGWVSVPVDWKSRYGAPTPAQEAFLAKWPAPTYVLKTEVECLAMLAELGAVHLGEIH